MKVINRLGEEIIVDQRQNNFLKWLYSHFLGRCILKVITRPFVSQIGGLYMNSSFSKKRIASFIEKNGIDMTPYPQTNYRNFNEFFTRTIHPEFRPIPQDQTILISPADSKLSYYKIDQNTRLTIKNSVYSVADLLQNAELAQQYENGICLICRLTVDDYHRYCFIDDGVKEEDVYIPGIFHTVNPIANDYYPIYKQNARCYAILHTQHFGDVITMEVGATMVGKIVNRPVHSFARGEEKGYFEFGASTVVLFFKKNTVRIDEDIIHNSSHHHETRVLMGEKIGKKYVK